MSRTVLSLILIGTMLLGQSFCCCTLRAFGSINIEANDSCCCKGAADPAKKCPQSPNEQGHHCPCKKVVNGEPSKQIQLPQGLSEYRHLLAEHADHSMASAVVCFEIDRSHHSRSRSFPNLDGVGILRAVCSLRC